MQRKLWSKKHGHDTYGDEEDPIDEDNVPRSAELRNKEKSKGKTPCNRCGSTNHSRSTHRDCPYNKKKDSNAQTEDESADIVDTRATGTVEESAHDTSPTTQVYLSDEDSDDSNPPRAHCDLLLSDDELDIDTLDYIVTSTCTCGALNRAHKKTCPMNSRARYPTERQHRRPKHTPGDYVNLHSSNLKDKHLTCRVVECLAKPVATLYRLCCTNGLIIQLHPESDLTKSFSTHFIPLDKWRTSTRIRVRDAWSDPSNLHKCECKRSQAVTHLTDPGKAQSKLMTSTPTADKTTIDLTNPGGSPLTAVPIVWIKNPLYTLHETDRQLINSPSGWLNDEIIQASQLLLAQHFPNVDGLQPPTLEQIQGFEVHFHQFIQILNVRNNHWILVSNLGCDKDVVHVYDTMYSSIPSSTVDTIARLVFCSSATLTIKMVEVDLQRNSSDCGVLCLAIAYDLLSIRAPCITTYDHELTRRHLSECLLNCSFSPFPAKGERSLAPIRYKNVVEVKVFCMCRLPEHPGEEWAECETCSDWFHRHCCEIPDSVFNDTQESWKCPSCKNTSA